MSCTEQNISSNLYHLYIIEILVSQHLIYSTLKFYSASHPPITVLFFISISCKQYKYLLCITAILIQCKIKGSSYSCASTTTCGCTHHDTNTRSNHDTNRKYPKIPIVATIPAPARPPANNPPTPAIILEVLRLQQTPLLWLTV